MTTRVFGALLALAVAAPGFGHAGQAPRATPAAAEAPSPYDALPPGIRALIDQPFTGDFDAMVKRRLIRVAVTFNRTHYFIDHGQQRGLTYDAVKLFEDELNVKTKAANQKVHVLFVALPRDLLYSALMSGKVDMVAAMVTVTPDREKLVDFSEPTRRDVSEVVVTGPGAPPIATADDLSGQEVFVRKGSIYAESLATLNQQLKARGKAPVVIVPAPEVLEDDDILEMVNAGLVNITVVDDYLATFWSKVLPKLKVQKLAVRSGGTLAIAMRKNSPQLRVAVNAWLKKHSKSDPTRAEFERRYLVSIKFAKNATSAAERKKFEDTVALFKKYSTQYKLDYLLMAAQGYQESTLDQAARNPSGAIGVMQVLPATGAEQKVGDITQLDPNIHAGVKYLRFMMDRYFANEPMDEINKGLMTFAAYNAGPGRIRGLRDETKKRGLDPNVWFGNVERVASERIGRETVQYVSNIFKYYVAYRLVVDQLERRAAAKARVPKPR